MYVNINIFCFFRCHITMVESGPGIVKPTETLDLTCKVTGASLTDRTNMYALHWVRQSERKQLEWLGVIRYNPAIDYGSSVQGRLTLTRDTNKGEVFRSMDSISEKLTNFYLLGKAGLLVFDKKKDALLLKICEKEVSWGGA
uniref:Immunoglobulin V-set domain-containing protein n=1 Tax=Pyxicephalus adspersus TaxID=30357 RepID=A0AAV3A067_PYXAD|nr:TPA: hypothetical protein GDO54_013545 [Pyxicephalus adspersus]